MINEYLNVADGFYEINRQKIEKIEKMIQSIINEFIKENEDQEIELDNWQELFNRLVSQLNEEEKVRLEMEYRTARFKPCILITFIFIKDGEPSPENHMRINLPGRATHGKAFFMRNYELSRKELFGNEAEEPE
jgi:hypothetical protein